MSTYFLKSHRIDLNGQCVEIMRNQFSTEVLPTGAVNLHVSLQAVYTREVSAAVLASVRRGLLPDRRLVPSGHGSTTGRGELEGGGGFRVRQEKVLLEVGHTRVRVVAHRALKRRGCRLTVVRLTVGVQRGDTGADFRTLGALELVSWSCGLDNIANSFLKVLEITLQFLSSSLQLSTSLKFAVFGRQCVLIKSHAFHFHNLCIQNLRTQNEKFSKKAYVTCGASR